MKNNARVRNIALGHHWLVGMRGGEKVLEQFSELFPRADIYTLVHNKKRLSKRLRAHTIRGSLLQTIPGAVKRYKEFLPLHPTAFAKLRVAPSAQLLLTSDASLAKGMNVGAGTRHACYCHSPPRYLWEMAAAYRSNPKGIGRVRNAVFEWLQPSLRRFDYEAAQRVDLFIANSNFVRRRIKKYYGRESVVIHPPVSHEQFRCDAKREAFFLVVSELVPYKRVDLAVRAFNCTGQRLVIIGDGTERPYLESIAKDNVSFLGRQPFQVLKQHYETCRAFVFPGIEDFGITPLEAQAAGGPVIAFHAGGALETVIDGVTGVFFHEQTECCLVDAIEKHETLLKSLSAVDCRANANRFGSDRFRNQIAETLHDAFPDLIDRPPNHRSLETETAKR